MYTKLNTLSIILIILWLIGILGFQVGGAIHLLLVLALISILLKIIKGRKTKKETFKRIEKTNF
jgi:membrane protein implicated in regulation of membrane protease activity